MLASAPVAPGSFAAIATVHATSSDCGRDLIRRGEAPGTVLATGAERRMPEAGLGVAGLAPPAAAGAPAVLRGDFNTPSHRDRTEAVAAVRPAVLLPVASPVTERTEAARFADAWRPAHPHPVARPGLTRSPGFRHPLLEPTEIHDRIGHILVADAGVRGGAGNPDADRATPARPSDRRAVVADLAAAAHDAPPLVAVEPRTVTAGDRFVGRAAGPGTSDLRVRFVPAGGMAIPREDLGQPPEPGACVVRLIPDDSRIEIARARFAVRAE